MWTIMKYGAKQCDQVYRLFYNIEMYVICFMSVWTNRQTCGRTGVALNAIVMVGA